MKIFDWDEAAKTHGREMIAFLKKVQHVPMTEDQFVERFCRVPVKFGQAKKGRRSPSYGRQQYKNLRDQFGFFTI